jgi:hypothetical protein
MVDSASISVADGRQSDLVLDQVVAGPRRTAAGKLLGLEDFLG